ncbi:MAG: hypothetical protein AB7N76_24275 [Planctomycetota bacterium]
MSVSFSSDLPASSGWARFLLRNFVVYNPLFLFSAMAVLGSAWALNPPANGGGRGLSLLLELFLVIQAYELTLLGAAWLLARRGGLERDVRNLHLVLAPFLLDVTFTTSSLSVSALDQAGLGVALALGAVVLVLAAVKLQVGLHLCGRTLGGPRRLVLLGGPALTLLTPLVGAALARHGYAREAALLAGLAAAALALAFGAGAPASATHPAEEQGATLRALAPLALGAALVHGCSTAYAYTAPMTWVAGPLLLALAPVIHRLAPRLQPDAHSAGSLLMAGVGALLCAGPEQGAHEGARLVSQGGLAAFSVLAGLAFASGRSLGSLIALLLGLRFLAGGGQLSHTLEQLGTSSLEPALLLALYGYGLWRRSPAPACALPLGAAALLLARQGHLGGNTLDLLLGGQVLGAGILAYAHRQHGCAPQGAQLRFAGALLLYGPATLVALLGEVNPDGAWWMSRGALVGLLALGALTRLRAYAVPALLLPLELCSRSLPATTRGWGVFGLAAAFAVVGLGVLVSLRREQLLAWLARGEEAPPLRPARRQEELAAGFTRGVLALIFLGVSAAVATPSFANQGGHQRSMALGSLKTIETAQVIYRERHEGRCAESLAELGRERLIDHALAHGEKSGYRFALVRSADQPQRWMAAATPLNHRFAQRGPKGICVPPCMAINDRGEVARAFAPIPLRADGDLPLHALRD